MKNIFFLLLILTSSLSAQISNLGFENWDASCYPIAFDIESPNCNSKTIHKDTNAIEGNYALNITSDCIYIDYFSSETLILDISFQEQNKLITGLEFSYKIENIRPLNPANDTLAVGCGYVSLYVYKGSELQFVDGWFKETFQAITEWNTGYINLSEQVLSDSTCIFIFIEGGSCIKAIGSDGNSNFIIDDIKFNYTTSAINRIIENISIYPNPTNDLIQVKSEGEFDIELSNLKGQTILNKKDNYDSTQLNIEVYPAGIYFLKIKKGNQVLTKKIIKQ